MPTYCYDCPECGTEFERTLPVVECRKKVLCECGGVGERNIVREHAGVAHRAGLWPMRSTAMGVHPTQVKDAAAHARRLGVPTDFSKGGEAIFTSARHRKAYVQAVSAANGRPIHDMNGGYTDP